MGWGWSCRGGVGWVMWGCSWVGGSCRGGVGNVRVGWGWVMHEWGGVGHAGVVWVGYCV